MPAQCLANPRTASASNATYLTAKQVFESSAWFGAFVQAIQNNKDYIPDKLFDPATGVIVINPKTGLIHQGVMAKNKTGYAWDTASNAFKLTAGVWTEIPVNTINIRHSVMDRIVAFARRAVGAS
jgi:hypothetical protein